MLNNNHHQQVAEMDMTILIQSDSLIYGMFFYGVWCEINAAEGLGLVNQLYPSGKLSL